MNIEPYASAQRVFVIVDNGSAHRGQRSINRLQGTWKNLILVHTPSTHRGSIRPRSTSASRSARCFSPTTSPTSTSSSARCWAFARHYEQIAQPFKWKFTHADLHQLLARLDQPAPLQLAA